MAEQQLDQTTLGKLAAAYRDALKKYRDADKDLKQAKVVLDDALGEEPSPF
jgi:hypothetical protein